MNKQQSKSFLPSIEALEDRRVMSVGGFHTGAESSPGAGTNWLKSLNRMFCRRGKSAAPHQRKHYLGLEALEGREVPATLQFLGGVLTYTAANGVANKLDVSANATSYTFLDTADKITVVGIAGATGSGTNAVTLPTSAVPTAGIALELGDQNDTLTIHSTLHAVTVKAGLGNDTIDIGTPVGGVLAAISAPVTLDGEAGTDTVRVNDPSGFLGFYTVTSTQALRSGGFAMTYAGAEQLTVNGGFFADTFDIRSTAASTRTTVNGGTGNDTFRVGNLAMTLDGIQGALTLNGGANDANFEDQVVFMDQGSAARSYTFRADQMLARSGSAMITHAGMERLTLNAGDFADSVAVTGTSAGTPLVLNMGAGNDTVTLGTPTSFSLNSIVAPVTVNGQGGTDSVVLNDQMNSSPGVYGLHADHVSYSSLDANRLLTYATMESLALRAGSGRDYILVASTAAQTPVVIQAGLGDDMIELQNPLTISGAVTVDGGLGTDTLNYFYYSTDVRVNLALGTATAAAGGVTKIENVCGGSGNDILVGNNSANVLWGGDGRDLIIGRSGADYVIGEGGDDILVGDSTAHDLVPARLENLMKEWARTDLTGSVKEQYKARVDHLLGQTPGGMNGTTMLTPAQVVSDGATDWLQGGAELDWFLTTGSDTIDDLMPRERVNDSPPVPVVIGDVTVTLAGGNLYINESADTVGLKHGITINRLPNGNILVTGHDPTNSGGISTLVNGAASMEFVVTGSLFVNLGDGEDQLVFTAISVGASPTLNDVTIGMGTDTAPDRVLISRLNIRGSLSIDTGGGNDTVFLSETRIGDGFGFDQVSLNTGAGDDFVKFAFGTQINGWVDVQTYGSLSENDFDLVFFDTETHVLRDVDVRMGGGADLLLVTDDTQTGMVFSGLTTDGSLRIDMGAGDDRAFIRGATTGGNFSLFTGAGADIITMDNRLLTQPDYTYFRPSVGGDLVVQTYESLAETDHDEVSMFDGSIHGSLSIRMGGGDDLFTQTYADFIGNDLTVDMGDGNDEAEVSAFVMDHLMILMGEGDDVLRLGKTFAYRLIANGGDGNDTLTKTTQTMAMYFDLLSWETVTP